MITGIFFVLGCDSENRDRWNGAPELAAPTSVPDPTGAPKLATPECRTWAQLRQ